MPRKKVSPVTVATEFKKIELKGHVRLSNKEVIGDLYENE